jgi:sodium/hydrogen exchanger 8
VILSLQFLKYVNLREIKSLEFVMWFIFGFGPYFIAEGLSLSGIMAVLFSGIVMSHYTHFNLSPVTQVTVQQTMRTVSFMAETVVFLYIGMQVFTITTSFSIGLIIWSLILILIGRAANIFPLSFLVNRFRAVQISPRMQFVMWFSGLRGAIAYALALNLQESVGEFASAETIRVLDTATLIIVLFTIVGLGASTLPLLKFLSKGSAVDEVTLSKTEDQGAAITYPEELEEQLSSHPPASIRHQWFLYLDYWYFRPFLIRTFTKREVHQARVDMQRRTNEWYQGLREASTEEEDEEDIVAELETTFSSPHLHQKRAPPPAAPWRGGASINSPLPPLQRKGVGNTKTSPTPQLWTEIQLESGQSSRSSGSNSSNSELSGVRDRTSSRSPPSGDAAASVLSSSS